MEQFILFQAYLRMNTSCSTDMKTVKMIIEQGMGYEEQCAEYTSELYNEDVQLISKDGRLITFQKKR